MNNYSKRNIVHIQKNPRESNNLAIVIPIINKALYSKAITPYNGKIAIEHQIIRLLIEFPQAEIFLLLGYESDKIIKKLYRKYPVRFITNDLYLSTNVVYGLSLVLQATLRSSLLIIYPNIHFTSLAPLTTDKTQVFSSNQINTSSVGLFVFGKEITGFSFTFAPKWARVTLLTDKEFEYFTRLTFDKANENLFDYELFNKCIENGGVFHHINGDALIKEIEG